MAKAPQITGLKAANVSANYINLSWDNLGGFFVYRVERSLNNANTWSVVGSTNKDNFWDNSEGGSPLIPQTDYDYRIITTGDGFDESDPTIITGITTFQTNLYSVLATNNITPYLEFVNGKLVNDNDPAYVDFNTDEIRVALTNDSYVYNPNDTTLEALIANGNILSNQSNPKRYGLVPQMCTVSFGTHSIIIKNPSSGNETLLVLEERQRVSLSSRNYAEDWERANVVEGAVIGTPSGNGIACGNTANTFVLGFDKILSIYDGSGSLNYNDISGGIVDSDTFNPTIGHRFYNYMNYPAGASAGDIQSITCSDASLYAVANGILYETSALGSSPTWATGVSILNDGVSIAATSAISKIEHFNGSVFVVVTGFIDSNGKVSQYDNSALEIPYPDTDTEQGVLFSDIGLYKYNGSIWVKLYGITDDERRKFTLSTSISRSATDLIFSLDSGAANVIDANANGIDDIEIIATDPNNPTYETDNGTVSNSRSARSVYYSTDGITFTKGQERFKFEEKHIYINGERSWTDHNRRFARLTNNTVQTKIVSNTSELWYEGSSTFLADDVTLSDFTGSATGALIYSKGADNLSGKLVAFYSFDSIQRNTATLDFNFDRVIIEAVLTNRILSEDEVVAVNESRYVHGSLAPLIQKMIPEDYIKETSLYTEFVKEYLRFISDDNDSVYGTMDRLLWNQDVNETELTDKFFGELYQRNIYASEEKRQLVNKFFTNTNNDFNSIKGTLDSYKYIFKLLYDVDIEVGLESTSRFEFYVNVDTTNFNDAIVGSTIVGANGSANVTYATRKFNNGVEFYELTLNNIFGEINNGDALTSIQVTSWSGTATSSVTGKDAPSDSDQFASRLRSYYTVTVKSPIPVGIYQNTILKYVHPIGFNFLGIYLIVSTVSSGLSVAHITTEFRGLYEYRWSAGVPDVYPLKIPNLDGAGDYKYTLDQPYYRIGYENIQPNNAGSGIQRTYLVKTPTEFTAGDPYPLPTTEEITLDATVPISYAAKYSTTLRGLDASGRRETKSPTFDQSNARFFDFSDWVGTAGITTLAVAITADDVAKSCTIPSSATQCSNTFSLSTLVTDSSGIISYSWAILSGTGILSSTNQATVEVTTSGNDGTSDILVVGCTITDSTSTDSNTITLSSSYGINTSAINASILTNTDIVGGVALPLDVLSSYRTVTDTTSYNNDLNGSSNRLTSRVSKDGKYSAMPYTAADTISANNAGMVVVFSNDYSNVATVEQQLTSQTPVGNGYYGLTVDIADSYGKYRVFVSDSGHAASVGRASAIDIWDLVGTTWVRTHTILTDEVINNIDGKIVASQDGNVFALHNTVEGTCTIFRTTIGSWGSYTEEQLPDPIYSALDISYYGDFIVKLEDAGSNDIHLMVHKWNNTIYATDKSDLGSVDAMWYLGLAVNDNASVIVGTDDITSGEAYVWEGNYPTYTKTLLDRSNLISYGFNSNNQNAMGVDVSRNGQEISVAYSSNGAFGTSGEGGVLIYSNVASAWVDSSYALGDDNFGVNHSLNVSELWVTQGSQLNSTVDKAIWYGLDNISTLYSDDELVCVYTTGGNCENSFIYGALASGGSGLYTYQWVVNSASFAISGPNDEKTVRLTRSNSIDTNESIVAGLTLRVTDVNTPSAGDPLYYDEDTLNITSTHINGIDPQVSTSDALSQRCYYANGGTCTITWAITANPINGVGGYEIDWRKESVNDTVFAISPIVGTSVTVTAPKPVGVSPIVREIDLIADVTDLGSTSVGSESTLLRATFLEIVGGSISANTTNASTCNYASGTCVNSWTLTALPTGGYDQSYTFSWVKVSGDAEVVMVGSTTSQTLLVESTNVADTDGTFSAIFKCSIVDADDNTNTGDTSTYTVTSTHTGTATDTTNISGLPSIIEALGAAYTGAKRAAYIQFQTNGTWNYYRQLDNEADINTDDGTWNSGSPSITGSEYEIFVSVSGVNVVKIPSQDALDTWLPMSSSRDFGHKVTDQSPFISNTYTVTIREIADNSNSSSTSFDVHSELT